MSGLCFNHTRIIGQRSCFWLLVLEGINFTTNSSMCDGERWIQGGGGGLLEEAAGQGTGKARALRQEVGFAGGDTGEEESGKGKSKPAESSKFVGCGIAIVINAGIGNKFCVVVACNWQSVRANR